MSEAKKTTNVNVCVRCRPLNEQEKAQGAGGTVKCDTASKQVTLTTGKGDKKMSKAFSFDRVFGTYSTQEEVFNTTVRPIVDEVLEGYNSTLFAFGPTGTGKTHTMEGDIMSEEMAGIVPRSVRLILEKLEASKAEYTVRVSFLELYNEELLDLLVDPREKSAKPLRLCEDVNKGVVCQNLEEVSVMGADHIFEILKKGIKQRQTAATQCNKNSSRSHSIFTLKIMIKETAITGEDVVRHGQLNLVDLAGSECVGRSGVKGEQKREAGSINQSLLTLGRVITALVDHHQHIPYRDSKLTRLLQESLGGKAKTCIIATLSPSSLAYEETLSTLDYAHRARAIKNAPQVNQRMGKRVVMKEFAQEIEQLRLQLQMTREKNGIYLSPEEFDRMENKLEAQESQLTECEAALKAREEEMKGIRAEREVMLGKVEALEASLATTSEKLSVSEGHVERLTTEVADTKMELQASDAVVGEQICTESQLSQAGAALKEESTKRRADVSSLLVKVDALVASETSRSSVASEYSALVKQLQADSLIKLDEMLQFSTTKTALMKSSIDELLYKGRTTCTSLDGSIQTALKALTEGVDQANSAIVESCSDVQGKLKQADGMIVDSLQNVKTDLSNWLGEVDRNMASAKDQLDGQMNCLTEMTASMAEQYNSTIAMHNSLARTVTAASDDAVKQLENLKDAIVVEMSSYREAQDVVVSQSKADMEKLKSLGQQLMALAQSETSRLDNMSDIMAAAQEGVSRVAVEHSTSMATALTEQTDQTSAELAAFGVSAKSNLENRERFLTKATTHNTATEQVLNSIASTVGAKRAQLDTTVGKITEDVHSTIESSMQQVGSMKTHASTMQSNVAVCSTDMTSSTKEATKTFVSFMDANGKTLVDTVMEAGSAIKQHIETQAGSVRSAGEHNNKFHKDMAGLTVKPRGSTPTKTVFATLPDLDATRCHAVIKDEVRAGVYSAPVKTLFVPMDLSPEVTVPQEGEVKVEAVIEAEIVTMTSDDGETISASSSVSSSSSPDTEDQQEKEEEQEPEILPAESITDPTPSPAPAPVEKKAAPSRSKRTSKLAGPRKRTAASLENTDPQTKSPRAARPSRRTLGDVN